MTLHEIVEEFNRRTAEVEPLLILTRDSGLQAGAVDELKSYYTTLETYRSQAEAQRAEHAANILLGFKSVVSGLAEELNLFRLLKSEEPDRAWDALVRAQAGFDAALRAHHSFDYLRPKAERLRELERYLFPPLRFLSAGMIVRRQECSICEADYAACDHLAGRPYCGRFCYIVLKEVEPNHVALVEEPANRHCRIVSFSTPEGRRNVMTWLVFKTEVREGEHTEDQFVAESVLATQMDFEGEQATGTAFPVDLSPDESC